MSDDVEVIRWYTKARKFPKFVGKLGLSGNPLPGGPYPVATVVGSVLTFLLGSLTMGIWGMGSVITNTGMLLGVSAGVGFGAGKLAVGGRNPLVVVNGMYRAVAASRVGELAGRPAHTPKPQRVAKSRVNVLVSAGTTAAPAPAPVVVEAPTPTPPKAAPLTPRRAPQAARGPRKRPAAPQPALSGVQALLAGSSATHSNERNI